jgi:hypothetical protein
VKATIEIDDSLFAAALAQANEEGVDIARLLEDALRERLARYGGTWPSPGRDELYSERIELIRRNILDAERRAAEKGMLL